MILFQLHLFPLKIMTEHIFRNSCLSIEKKIENLENISNKTSNQKLSEEKS